MRTFFSSTSLLLLLVAGQVGAFSPPYTTPTLSRATVALSINSQPSFVARKSNLHLSNNNHDNNVPVVVVEQQSNNNSRIVSGLALAVAALAVLPQTGMALDVSGGAVSLVSTTTTLWNSLLETGFYQAFSLVFLSEIGDKTFFIAGLLAMKTSRVVSYLGSMGALASMTVLSVLIGQLFHAVPSGFAQGIPLDDVAAVLAFAFFGYKTLSEALATEGESIMEEEFADAEETVAGSETIKQATAWAQILSTFGLVFAAEFGDRSFLATIALSAAQNPVSVAGGAIAAHGVATGIAVVGGAYVSKYISEKVIGVISGTLFLVFAFTTAFGIF